MASLQACNTCLHHYSLAIQRGFGMRTAYIDWPAMCCVLCFTYAVFFYPPNWPVILNHLHFTDEGVKTRKEGSLVLVHRVGLGFESKLWGSMLSPQLWPGLQPPLHSRLIHQTAYSAPSLICLIGISSFSYPNTLIFLAKSAHPATSPFY